MVSLIKLPELPLIHFSKKNDIVERLLEIIHVYEHNTKAYKDENDRLKEIIAELQNAPKRPDIRPSSIEKPTKQKPSRTHEPKEPKADRLIIHEHRIIRPEKIPNEATFKGHRSYFIQDIDLRPHNILFKIERWQLSNGSYLPVPLPKAYKGFHFGPKLRSFILQQYYQARVTRPKLIEQLRSWGIEISVGEINSILVSQTPMIENELKTAVSTAIENSSYIQTDDTGARHKGKNHVCTQIGNHLFTYFCTGESKSRLSFLELLNQAKKYSINEACIDYLKQHSSQQIIKKIKDCKGRAFTAEELKIQLTEWNLGKNQERIVREAVNIGFLKENLGERFIVLSDGAPQYAVLEHAGCWIHALRLLEKEYPIRREKAEEIVKKLRRIYHHLKRYKRKQTPLFRKRIEICFDQICDLRTGINPFDKALERFSLNKRDLLKVLEFPEIPLHNNMSENDIREYVIRRKISGGTRSEIGRRSRDAFCSLLKTCTKLKIEFWRFIEDRWMQQRGQSLSELIIQRVINLHFLISY